MTALTLWDRQQTYDALKAVVLRIPRLRESKVLITMQRVDRMLRGLNAAGTTIKGANCIKGVDGNIDAGTAALSTCLLIRAGLPKLRTPNGHMKLGIWHTWAAPLGRLSCSDE